MRTQARGDFPPTRWSLVLKAQTVEEGSPESLQALEHFCKAYWFPLYAYVRRRGHAASDAEDLTQGFFARLLDGDRLQLLNEEKGSLRAYLLRAMKNYLNIDWQKRTAKKRGGTDALLPSNELAIAEERYSEYADDQANPEVLYERRWALTLLQRAFERLEEE